ncbi:hypothetical protein [Sporisorium scitamineum]|uniref:Uncharacterized protein n=1 Tax=Sporisorium scitamineum TaxID=49012 RepID=A0A0F7S836_9BASI|nr:hypothetical protein [Sporisorium scitamineum]
MLRSIAQEKAANMDVKSSKLYHGSIGYKPGNLVLWHQTYLESTYSMQAKMALDWDGPYVLSHWGLRTSMAERVESRPGMGHQVRRSSMPLAGVVASGGTGLRIPPIM